MTESTVIWSGATKAWRIPLWERWPSSRLKDRRAKIGSRSYARGYQQQTLADEDLTFPSAGLCAVDDLVPTELLTIDWAIFVGVDISSETRPGNVLVVIAQRPHDKKRMVVDIRTGKWTSPQVWREMEAVERVYRPRLFMVENNATQEAILQWGLEMNRTLPVRGFTTGHNKADVVLGLPGLEVEFENRGWLIPRYDHGVACDCVWCRFWTELAGHPLAVSDDMVMALWFAREAARMGRRTLQAGQSPVGRYRG